MEAAVFPLASLLNPLPSLLVSSRSRNLQTALNFRPSKNRVPQFSGCRCKSIEEEKELAGLPKEYYDDEWQARQREKTKEFHRKRQEEDEEEERKVDEYREIGMRLKQFPQEDLMKAKKLVASFIKSAEEIEEKIEESALKGELDELVLMVIWSRLDLARRDDEKDAIRSLDLLYRRVEAEILKSEATPAMRMLNDMLNMHDGFDDEGWLKQCKKRMLDTFPREDPFSIIVPAGFDIDKHKGPLAPALSSKQADAILLRVDFVREVAQLLQEVKSEFSESKNSQGGLDPESIATRLKKQEKQRVISQHKGPLAPALSSKQADAILLRVDFVREVAQLLQEVKSEFSESKNSQGGLDPESIATRLKKQEKQRVISQVETLLDLAVSLNY